MGRERVPAKIGGVKNANGNGDNNAGDGGGHANKELQ
jgi:hypothetical protein